MKVNIVFILFASAILFSCTASGNYGNLQRDLTDFVKDKNAKIGVAVIIDGKDTISVNGTEDFPMLSVYKFPIALALADNYTKRGVGFDRQIPFNKDDLHLDTYSPMTEKFIADDKLSLDGLKLAASDLLRYMLEMSDNNASDIVLKHIGGPDEVMRYLKSINITEVKVISTENEMHDNPQLSYLNSSTPIAMASLIDFFDRQCTDSLSLEIKRMLESCDTGTNRLVRPLKNSGVSIGHKTGTGFPLPDGGVMAVNDVGYIHLSETHRYSIAVFIADSHYDMAHAEDMIAEISRMVYTALSTKR